MIIKICSISIVITMFFSGNILSQAKERLTSTAEVLYAGRHSHPLQSQFGYAPEKHVND